MAYKSTIAHDFVIFTSLWTIIFAGWSFPLAATSFVLLPFFSWFVRRLVSAVAEILRDGVPIIIKGPTYFSPSYYTVSYELLSWDALYFIVDHLSEHIKEVNGYYAPYGKVCYFLLKLASEGH